MNRRQLLIAFVIALLCHNCNTQNPAVDPPIVDVINNVVKGKVNKQYDVKIQKYARFIPMVKIASPEPTDNYDDTTTSATTITSSTPDNDIMTNDIQHFHTTTTELNEDQDCKLSFILPNHLPENREICIKKSDTMTSQTSELEAQVLRNRVTETERTIENLKREMTSTTGMKNEIRLLQKESRNMNFRVSQLYMQLLHEIIRKRDDTIEFTTLENKILNQTIKYLELKEKIAKLEIDNQVLKQQNEVQQGQIDQLQQSVAKLLNKVEIISRTQIMSSDSSGNVPGGSLEEYTRQTTATHSPGIYRNCIEIQQAGFSLSGEYNLKLPSMNKRIRVWCDFDQDPGGWIVIQRRSEPRVNFYRNMASYQRGFGMLSSDFWLGLDNIHHITVQSGINYKLHIDMEDWSGRKTFVEYQSFKVEGEDDGYRLKIGRYNGNAGDSLTWHNNMKFTTKNIDNDPFGKNCANYQKGGWWYNQCAHSNLNGRYYLGGHYRSKYQDGIYWSEWRGGSYSLKKVEMKIQPTE